MAHFQYYWIMPQTTIIITIVAFALLPVSAVAVFARMTGIVRLLGERTETFPPKSPFQFVGILILAPILIALPLIRDFDPLTVFAISGVGVMGFYIACQEIAFARHGGICSKGVIWNSTWVLYEDVDSIARSDPNTLMIVLNDRTRKFFVSSDTELVSRIAGVFESVQNPLQ